MTTKKQDTIEEEIYELAEPAEKYPKDWLVIPAIDIIKLIRKRK